MNPKDLVGAKKAPLRYVPSALMIEASGPMEDGALKYGPFNWREQPVEVITYIEAVLRHLYAFLDGQDFAEDSGHSHIGHAIAGLGIIADANATGTLIDNRYTAGPAADMLRARDKSTQMNSDVPKKYAPLSLLPPPEVFGQFDGIVDEPFGEGDGPIYRGTPVEAPDGCIVYRGKHVHPLAATPDTYRDIDRDFRLGGGRYRPSEEF